MYTELYLSASFSQHPSLQLFLQTALAISLTILVIAASTYYLLYVLMPRWTSNYRQPQPYAEGILLILLATLGIRLVLRFVVWPWIYGEDGPQLNAAQWSARYFYSMLGLLQVMALAAAIRLFRLRISAIKREKTLVQEQLNAELRHLKSQLHPHFLFNTINSIYSLTRKRDDQAPEALMQLSGLLRHVLYETSQRLLSLSGEVGVIKDYIELQQLRFGSRLKADLEEDIDAPQTGIAPLLLLPLVENAYKHGSDETGTIRIRIGLKSGLFYFSISNPAAENSGESMGGIGLANVERRLQLLYSDSSLQTSFRHGIFNAELRLAIDSYVYPELPDHRR